jgi:erythromycin esterase-like protein
VVQNNPLQIRAVGENADDVAGSQQDYGPLMELIDDSRFVLIGEASHGTHEFYQTRAEITERLIKGKGFLAVAVEADWPDAYRVNSYVQGRSDDAEAVEALGSFKRFPTWMWRKHRRRGVCRLAAGVQRCLARRHTQSGFLRP